MAMTPTEYAGWIQHLTRYPRGDRLLQILVAQISMALSEKPLHEVAPWLELPEDRIKREAQAAHATQTAWTAMVGSAYHRSKNNAR